MNRNMKYILTVLFLLYVSLTYSQKQENNSLTIKDIISLTVKNHPLLKQKEDELRAIQFKVEQQRSSYLPTVNGLASYTRIGPIPAFAFGGEDLELAPANNYNLGVIVHHTLYDFGRRELMLDYTTSFINSVKDNEDYIKNDLSNQAIKIFYGILFLEKSIAVKDTQYAALQEHLKVTELKIKDGTATDYDVLSTKTRMVEIKNEKIELLNEKNKQELYLKELIGLDRKKEFSVSGYFNLPSFGLSVDSLMNQAYKQRMELRLVADAIKTASIQKDLVSQSDKPLFNVNLGYGFKNGYEPNIEVLRGNWFAGVSIEVPIYNGNLTENKVNEAGAVVDAANKKVNQIKESISTEIYQSVSDLKTGIEKLKSAKEQIDYAMKSLERAKVQYVRGAGTNIEVLDAETALTQARLLNIQVTYKNIINYYSLRRAVGDKIFLE